SRRVTFDQYRAVLAAARDGEAPALAAADDGERARRGLAGLRDDVWPALHWAVDHRDVLAMRVNALPTLHAARAAYESAQAWLPTASVPRVRLHVVMGGRAGAAAIGDDIYFDVLSMSFKDSRGVGAYPSSREVVEFFAHEIHHVGVAPL